MFCNEWTWVSLKKVQIKRVEKDRKRLRPCGRWKKERRRLAPLPNSVNSYSAAINLLVLARGFRLINHNPPHPLSTRSCSSSCLLNVRSFSLLSLTISNNCSLGLSLAQQIAELDEPTPVGKSLNLSSSVPYSLFSGQTLIPKMNSADHPMHEAMQ